MVKLEKKRLELHEQRTENLKLTILWLGRRFFSGWVGTLIYISSVAVALTMGAIWGINTPLNIPCPNKQSLCYQLRFDKSQVLLPEEINQVLQKYGISEKEPK